MIEVLYYAFPFFLMLLIAEWASFRHLAHDFEDEAAPLGYEKRDTRTSITMGVGSVFINVGWKAIVVLIYAALYELTPLRLDDGSVFVLDRGWVSIGTKQDAPDSVPAAPAGRVAVRALLRTRRGSEKVWSGPSMPSARRSWALSGS